MAEQHERDSYTGLEIAVIGMAGRFPGAENIHEFWENLKEGRETISFFTHKELDELGIDAKEYKAPGYVCAKGVLESAGFFDSNFFGYSPGEADMMDPQTRLFHECTWHALENAGYNPEVYDGLIGLYAGSTSNLYWEMSKLYKRDQTVEDQFSARLFTDKDYLPTRIAYKLNLNGPCYSVNTACSTSLVAVHLGVQGLLNAECDIAVTGGISITLPHRSGYLYQEGMVMSSDGHCRTFDIQSGGTVMGDGMGAVVLKRLEDALDHRDHIYAVIKGSAINNDGFRKIGFTAPSIEGQAEVITAALNLAEVEPESIGYIEAHGTGTPVGDPMEISALERAFHSKKKQFCRIGSVKTNVGHLFTTSGIAGFIKTVLALKHKLIPPSLHFTSANPQIDFKNSPFYVNTQLTRWENRLNPLRAGVSSFGIGGTNAHVILEEAPEEERKLIPGRQQLLLLSAKGRRALDKMMEDLARYFKENPRINIADAAYTLRAGRKTLEHRCMLTCSSMDEAIRKLSAPGEGGVRSSTVKAGAAPAVIFMFSGQGTQYIDMGLDLYQQEPVFQKVMDRGFDILNRLLGVETKCFVYPESYSQEIAATEKLQDLIYSGPLKLLFEYSLATLLMGWGIQPKAMIGHSLGEYVAACLAGVFSIEDALTLAVTRGELMASTPPGTMTSVPLPETELLPLISMYDGLSLAAVNAPSLCIVSGPTSSVANLEQELEHRGYKSVRMNFHHASHSKMMLPIVSEFKEKARGIVFNPPQIPYISGLTGNWITAEEAMSPSYWTRHLHETIRFSYGLENLLNEPEALLLEMGPGKGLTLLLEQQPAKTADHVGINLVRHKKERVPDTLYTLDKMGEMWLHGASADWEAIYPGEASYRVPLLPYPFEKRPYSLPNPSDILANQNATNAQLSKNPEMSEWFYIPTWERSPLPPGAPMDTKKTFLLLTGTGRTPSQLADELKKKLNGKSCSVTVVSVIGEFRSLVKAIPPLAGHIIYICSEDVPIDEPYGDFFNLLHLTRVLGDMETNTGSQFQLDVITTCGHDVIGTEELSPLRSTVLGPVTVIPQEYPHIICRNIDIQSPGAHETIESLTGQLVREITTLIPDSDRIVAHRNCHRWVQRFAPIRLPGTNPSKPPFKKGSVYLVTGGTGKIGLSLARHLVSEIKARVVLIGRTKLRMDELDGMGENVLALQADVSCPEQMEAAFLLAEETFGPVTAVIHSAGIIGQQIYQSIKDITESQCIAQFRAKITGVQVLETVLESRDVEYCLLMSSDAAVLGGLGFSAYSAANRYMDGFVHYKQRHNGNSCTRWLSVNWDSWQGDDRPGQDASTGSILSELAITHAEGIEAMELILSWPEAKQVIQSTGDLHTRIRQSIKREDLQGAKEWEIETNALRSTRPPIDTPYEAPGTPVEKDIAGIWESLLGFNSIGVNDNFFQLGGDSLKAVKVIYSIHKRLNFKIPIVDFFSYPTVRELAQLASAGQESSHGFIEPAEKRSRYPLSSTQKRMFLLNRQEAESTAYNIPAVRLLEGIPDQETFRQAFHLIIDRHESFRTSFELVEGIPVQKVHDSNSVDFMIERLAPIRPIKNAINNFIRPFDLSKAPLLRLGLLKLEETKHILILDMHHIISDGTSMGILLKEFMAFYKGNKPSPLSIQYKDYAVWQNRQLTVGALEKQEAHWLKELAGEVPSLDLPLDFSRPKTHDSSGRQIHTGIGPAETAALNKLAAQESATLYMVLLALYGIWLSRLGGREEMHIGAPIAGRSHADLDNVIGMFVNTLILKLFPSGNLTHGEFLAHVKEKTLAAYENQDYPFDTLVEKLGAAGTGGSLFSAAFLLQNMEIPPFDIRGLTLKPYPFEHSVSRFDITLIIVENKDKLHLTFEYSSRLFKDDTLRHWIGCFMTLVSSVLENPVGEISQLEMLAPDEKEKMLVEFNNSATDCPRNKTIQELFSEQVEQTSDRIAVIGDVHLSYRELDHRASHLAAALIEKGVTSDTIVGLMVERSEAMMIGIFGILKTGGAYLPIESDAPQERIDYILKDSNATFLVTGDDIVTALLATHNSQLATGKVSATNLAYIIYTSGSTGKAKGNLTTHRNVTRVVTGTNYIQLTAHDRILQLSNYAFDGSVFDIYGALLNGAALVLVKKEEVLELDRLSHSITREGITVFFVTTALFNALVDVNLECFLYIRLVLFGGERVSVNHTRRLLEFIGSGKIMHMYGPTETTVYASAYDIQKIGPEDHTIPIGPPLTNTSLYVLDKRQQPVPIGVFGELYIGGDGLARGYLNRPQLTDEKFVELNWSHRSYRSYSPNSRLYKTGDLVRWLPTGDIEFQGRVDHQVKIRGFRIEPGEVEDHLLRHDDVEEAIVITRAATAGTVPAEDGDKYLCAYFVTVSGEMLAPGKLREFLSRSLPHYMVPAAYVQLDRMPLNPNGKVDRKALPEPKFTTDENYIAPRDKTEAELTNIWNRVLNRDGRIGINDNFFDIGGHSLLVLKLINTVRQSFNVKISFQDIYTDPTITALARLIRSGEKSARVEIARLEERDHYELSYTQERLWLLNKLDPVNPGFNMVERLTLDECVDEAVIRRVLETLIQRHESFRTYFKEIDGRPMQVIEPSTYVNFEVFDLTLLNNEEKWESRERLHRDESREPFNLELPPLLRAKLVKCSEEEYDVILTLHHIIFDGWSLEVLEREFFLIYDAYKRGNGYKPALAPLRIQYRDYAAWHNRLLLDEQAMQAARDFWKRQLIDGGDPVPLELPYDNRKKNLQDKTSAGFRTVIPGNVLDKLNAYVVENNASLFTVLLAGFYIFLSQTSGQDDIVLAVPGAGRQHDDLKNIIGFFVNTLILRNRVDPDDTFVRFLGDVRANIIEVLEHQGYPLELICSELKIKYPEISVFFNMSLFGQQGRQDLEDLESRHIPFVQNAKFDIVLYLEEYRNGVEINTHYYKELFHADKIEKFMQRYIEILKRIAGDTGKHLKEYGKAGKKLGIRL